MRLFASALLLAVVFAVSGAFADAANTLIVFSTPGPDKYADGEVVVDGEKYALVWTAGEDFEGFTTAGEPINANQKVLQVAPHAKDGHCILTLFQIDSSEAPKGGIYSVYLLDTRGSKGQTIVTGSALAKTYKPSTEMSNAAQVAEDNTKTSDGSTQSVQTSTKEVAIEQSAELLAPVITGIKVEGAEVKISVSNVFPGLTYEVKGGLDKAGELEVKGKALEGNQLELTVDKEAAQFFSIKAK